MLHLYREAVRGLPASVWWFAGASLINRAGTMVVPFFTLYLRDALTLSPDQIAWVVSAFGAGGLAGTYVSGPLVDRFGGRAMVIASLVLGGLAFFGLMALRSFGGLAAGAFVTAAVSEAFRPAVMASIAAVSNDSNRARSFGLLRLAVNAGMAIGPTVGGLLAAVNFDWVFIGEGVTCLLAAGVLSLAPIQTPTVGEPKAKSSPPAPAAGAAPLSAQSPWRDGPYLVFLVMVLVLATGFFQLFFTLTLHLKDTFGWSEWHVGLLIGMNALLIVVIELPLVTALQRRSQIVVYGIGALFIGAGFAVFLFGVHPVVPVTMIVLASIGEMLVFPASNVVAAGRAPPDRIGRYVGLYATSMALAFVLAPWVGLRIYDRWGASWLWAVTSVACFASALMALGPVRKLLENERSPASDP